MVEQFTAAAGHRTDIDGLRAFAVAAVVAYHMRAPFAGAGFVGVDVFFVVSGFLISGILFAEIDRSGGVDLLRCWGRRIRRLAPAATAVLVLTLVACYLLTSPLSWHQVARTAIPTSVYGNNLFFGREASNYFASDAATNPLLHYWSLAVEEQFYVVWPLLLLGAARLARHRLTIRRRAVLLGAIALASFAYSAMLTYGGSPWAYYSPLSRAWELAVGGLLAVVLPRGLSGSERRRHAVGVAGIAVFVVTAFTITGTTPFPGVAALLPVTATVLLLAAAPNGRGVLDRALAARPVQWVGRLSYSWYLWHWPVLVIGQLHQLSTARVLRLELVALSLALAAATHALVENPIRFSRSLSARPVRNLGLAALTMLLGLGGAVVLGRRADARSNEPALRALAIARADEEFAWDNRCGTTDLDILTTTCAFGDTAATRTVVLAGDSHAAHWMPALDVLGREQHFRLVARVKGGCPAAPVRAYIDPVGCSHYQETMTSTIRSLHASAVIVTNSAEILRVVDDATWVAAVRSLATELSSLPVRVGWMADTPTLANDPVDCVALHGLTDCEPDATSVTAHAARLRVLTASALGDRTDVTPFDPMPLVCSGGRCPLEIDDRFVYRDANHLTRTFCLTLAPALEPFVTGLLRT